MYTEEVLKQWFDTHLRADRKIRGYSHELNPKCIYYDWTSCSAGELTCSVFLLENGKYRMVIDTGHVQFQGGPINFNNKEVLCDDICSILVDHGSYDGNKTCGMAIYQPIYEEPEISRRVGRIDFVKLDKSKIYDQLFEYINNYKPNKD